MVYTCYDKIYTVLGIGRAPPGLPGPRAPPAWYQALPEQAQKACLLGALASFQQLLSAQWASARYRAHVQVRGVTSFAAVTSGQEDAMSEAFWKQESKPLGSAQSVDVKFEDCWALIATDNASEQIIKWRTSNNIFEAVHCA